MEENGILQQILGFMSGNMAYILLVVSVLYFVWFFYSIVKSRRTGEGFSFKFKSFFAFLLIIGFVIYCLVTGQDFSSFIY